MAGTIPENKRGLPSATKSSRNIGISAKLVTTNNDGGKDGEWTRPNTLPYHVRANKYHFTFQPLF
jgi:hypothetical protein